MDVGEEITGRPYTLTTERMLAFSGGPLSALNWPARNLHTDAERAKEAGLEAPIASGIQYEGYLIKLLLELFGDDWTHRGTLRVKYTRPVFAGDTLQAKVRVREVEQSSEGIAYGLDVSCEKQGGDTVLVGTADCRRSA